ncbi:MAG: hypothetical protein WC934_06825 [Acidithiobacillus sp.]|jgi:hypothetical protein|uniref:hypothetical protein n=1 Tax=Acidithiobacillus sp. TaxID=1872118 RepID=UPI00355F5AC9
MREKLKNRYNERSRFQGTFIRFGVKHGYKHQETTVLLCNIYDLEKNLLTDHLWFNFTSEFKRLWTIENLHVGHIIEFNARIKKYEKGYNENITIDYHLSHPRKLNIIGKNEELWEDDNCSPPFELLRIKAISDKVNTYYSKKQSQYSNIPILRKENNKNINLDTFFDQY